MEFVGGYPYQISSAVFNSSDPNPLLKTCDDCGRPRDNSHQTCCPICLMVKSSDHNA